MASAKVTESAQAQNSVPMEISRREFLYTMLGVSLATFGVALGGGALWFMLPAKTEANGFHQIDIAEIPISGLPPTLHSDHFVLWLSRPEKGLLALHRVCTDHGCFYKWVSVNHRFECPCCGSKFKADGRYIEGPAKRNLDRYVIEVTTDRGYHETPADRSAVNIDGARSIIVNINAIIRGQAVRL